MQLGMARPNVGLPEEVCKWGVVRQEISKTKWFQGRTDRVEARLHPTDPWGPDLLGLLDRDGGRGQSKEKPWR